LLRQEGIDFPLVVPRSCALEPAGKPGGFEQREGRVNRFGGHAVRRNIAARHRVSVMTSQEADRGPESAVIIRRPTVRVRTQRASF
jgi:hypothetical protein